MYLVGMSCNGQGIGKLKEREKRVIFVRLSRRSLSDPSRACGVSVGLDLIKVGKQRQVTQTRDMKNGRQ